MKPKKQIVLPRNITKLDLGDTNHGEGQPLGKNWTSISLEGDKDCDGCECCKCKGFKYKLKGDYSNMPYKSNSFSYAYGGCFLEFETADTDAKKLKQFKEVYRVLKKGGTFDVCGCMTAEGVEEIRDLEREVQHYMSLAVKVGFTVSTKWQKEMWAGNYNGWTDVPHIMLKKK